MQKFFKKNSLTAENKVYMVKSGFKGNGNCLVFFSYCGHSNIGYNTMLRIYYMFKNILFNILPYVCMGFDKIIICRKLLLVQSPHRKFLCALLCLTNIICNAWLARFLSPHAGVPCRLAGGCEFREGGNRDQRGYWSWDSKSHQVAAVEGGRLWWLPRNLVHNCKIAYIV